jgi:antitoxin MazE
MKGVKFVEQIERKVTKIGNSIGITLPPEILKQVGLAQGDDVQVEVKDGKIILRKKEHLQLPDGVDAEFMEILNSVIKEHDKAFKGLVNR